MGRKAKKETPIKVRTTPRGRRGTQCGEELQQFFTCMAKAGSDVNSACAKEIASLRMCAATAAKKPRVINTINYHLQRISRLMR
ncbi:37S ribosomal protein mrp10 [Picochlorum sp. SENEW3]|nr:37S ribosomal protein mrp10 [Picochlorum sp. SENEW3]